MQALAIITLPSYLVSVSLLQKTDPNCFLWLEYHSVHPHNRTLQALAIITLPFYCLSVLLASQDRSKLLFVVGLPFRAPA